MDINVISTGTHGRGGTYFDREISKAQYEAAMANQNHRMPKSEADTILTYAERYGYGASCSTVFEQDGKYYVHCHMWNSCD